ncbi:5556_t:CDS:1 [Scutellospora calospora]|uniref:5556_t:CDS:1 n=1 Tax=Scutellospora calospora TaxID=85575 RepID=A0ACA9LZ67_9GLOM|nr:5556_t:CDS:1 [Scutellospora calospora]
MKQNFILVFILLATLSIVNAQLHKRATKFGPCRLSPPVSHFTTITLSPDPITLGKNVSVTLTEKLDKDIPASSKDVLQVLFLDSYNIPSDLFSIDLCTATGIKCPIPQGTEISTTVSVLVPGAEDLPKGSTIEVSVREKGAEVDFIICSLSDPIS